MMNKIEHHFNMNTSQSLLTAHILPVGNPDGWYILDVGHVDWQDGFINIVGMDAWVSGEVVAIPVPVHGLGRVAGFSCGCVVPRVRGSLLAVTIPQEGWFTQEHILCGEGNFWGWFGKLLTMVLRKDFKMNGCLNRKGCLNEWMNEWTLTAWLAIDLEDSHKEDPNTDTPVSSETKSSDL